MRKSPYLLKYWSTEAGILGAEKDYREAEMIWRASTDFEKWKRYRDILEEAKNEILREVRYLRGNEKN